MNTSPLLQSRLLATKFFMLVALHLLIPRPRLAVLLDESLKHPFPLISAPPGFGKTTALSVWAQSLQANNPVVAWVSLDEGDNEPLVFWTNIVAAFDKQRGQRFTPLLTYLQSSQAPPLKYTLTAFINLLVDSAEHFVLILDDYHLITEPQSHTSLLYLINRFRLQIHIILPIPPDPSLPPSLLRPVGE